MDARGPGQAGPVDAARRAPSFTNRRAARPRVPERGWSGSWPPAWRRPRPAAAPSTGARQFPCRAAGARARVTVGPPEGPSPDPRPPALPGVTPGRPAPLGARDPSPPPSRSGERAGGRPRRPPAGTRPVGRPRPAAPRLLPRAAGPALSWTSRREAGGARGRSRPERFGPSRGPGGMGRGPRAGRAPSAQACHVGGPRPAPFTRVGVGGTCESARHFLLLCPRGNPLADAPRPRAGTPGP